MECPKCGYTSGDDWSQCHGGCPMPGSPHYDEEAEAPGRMNVATYDDWFPDQQTSSPIVAQQQCGDWIDDFEAGNAAYAASFAL